MYTPSKLKKYQLFLDKITCTSFRRLFIQVNNCLIIKDNMFEYYVQLQCTSYIFIFKCIINI